MRSHEVLHVTYNLATAILFYSTILYHDLRHSKASIDALPNLFLHLVIVNPALENNLSGDANIAGIDSKSKAIFRRFGKSQLEVRLFRLRVRYYTYHGPA
jgi:hypothetical protein